MVVATANVGWDTIATLVFRPRVGELLFNTLSPVLITVPLCVLIGVGGAWLVERTSLAGNKAWAVYRIDPRGGAPLRMLSGGFPCPATK